MREGGRHGREGKGSGIWRTCRPQRGSKVSTESGNYERQRRARRRREGRRGSRGSEEKAVSELVVPKDSALQAIKMARTHELNFPPPASTPQTRSKKVLSSKLAKERRSAEPKLSMASLPSLYYYFNIFVADISSGFALSSAE